MASIAPEQEAAVPLKTWIAVGGAFMAVLNIQITNASLPDIEGGIGTGGINGAWVITAYLIGEIIVIPMTDFLSRVFSLHRYLIASTALFLCFSVACGQASSLSEMIVLRALQGFSGGVLIPLAFTIVVAMLPPSKRPLGLAGFAITATFAPAIGPTIGGWLTDNYGWQTIFYINVVPGIVMLVALIHGLPRSPMQLGLLRRGDWIGIALMAVGLAALQTVLDEGTVYDWFASPFIVRLSLLAGVMLTAFIVVELTVKEPLVQLGLFTRRNFAFGTLGNFLLGFALYGSAYLLPQYLAASQGFNAQQIGEVMAWTGLPQLIVIPFVPLLMRHIDPRLLVGVGLTVFAASCFMNLHLDVNYAAPQLLAPDITRALGQAIAMTPRAAIAMVGISRQRQVVLRASSTCSAISAVRSAHRHWRHSSQSASSTIRSSSTPTSQRCSPQPSNGWPGCSSTSWRMARRTQPVPCIARWLRSGKPSGRRPPLWATLTVSLCWGSCSFVLPLPLPCLGREPPQRAVRIDQV